MEESTKVTGKMEHSKDEGSSKMQMEESMKEIGKMEGNMEKELSSM